MDEEKKPLISVIIPCYNSENYIEEVIRSVLNQTYTNFEIIVIDDGSTDKSLNLCKEIEKGDNRITVLHTENYGVSHARNLGIDLSKGTYVVFLDSDDMLTSDSLEILLNLLTENNADIAIGNHGNNSIDLVNKNYENIGCIWKGTEALIKSLEDHPATYSACGKLFKKNIVKDTKFPEGIKAHEDSFFNFLCFLKKPNVIVSNEKVVIYRQHQGSNSKIITLEKLNSIISLAKEKKEIIANEYPELSYLAENVLIKAHMVLLNVLNNSKETINKDLSLISINYIKTNKKYYIPVNKKEKLKFLVITNGLYFPYKIFVRVKKLLIK